ncbi:acyl-homoserine-lactone synthase [Erwinia sp. AnSW2-5]|uniref:acyl-homoserine-lactone synthase n=1 Tax=Erwinia sp. AnSW2-5 TaxID=3367692 RepID=UPI00385D2E00
MLSFFDIGFNFLNEKDSKEIYTLRKRVFKDRLNWMVECSNGMESDEYDCCRTIYLLGGTSDYYFCGVRFIETKYPNMITGAFKGYFDKFDIPKGNFIEASRLFIEKGRSQQLRCQGYPVSTLLFLSMINYARSYQYEGIYAIVSHPMYVILKRSGWLISIIEKSVSEKKQDIYLIFMPVDEHSQHNLISLARQKASFLECSLNTWPLSLSVRENGSD